MNTSSRLFTLRFAIAGISTTGALLAAGDGDTIKIQSAAVPMVTAEAEVARSRENEHQPRASDVVSGARRNELTDIQLAERIVREEKMLASRQERAQALAKSQARPADEIAADMRMSEELEKATSSAEREAIMLRYRAYRRMVAKAAAATAAGEKK